METVRGEEKGPALVQPLTGTGEPSFLPYHVLLRDVALHIAIGVFVLEELRERGVLGVSIQSDHMLVVTAQLGQSHTVRLPCSNLVTRAQTANRSHGLLAAMR